MRSLSLLCAAVALLALPGFSQARDESRTDVTMSGRAMPGRGEIAIRARPALNEGRPRNATRIAGVGAQPVLGQSDVPIGWVQFCQERPGDCGPSGSSNAVVELTAAREAELRSVNLSINHALKPVPDIEHYGVVQRWTIPTDGMGSCHHYMLMKRRELEARGWPRSALLVTVVRTQAGIGHAILTARTSKGDLILDNLTDRIVGWNQTGYHYLMRQSGASPNTFLSLGGARSYPVATAARAAAPSLPAQWWQSTGRSRPIWHPWQ